MKRTAFVVLVLTLLGSVNAQSATIQTIDLLELAPQAVWTSTRGDVTFGDDQYAITIADYRYNVRLNDGSTVSRTLYTPIFEYDVKTNVTGLFNLKLPQAGKITLNCQVNAIQNWMHGVGAHCTVPSEGITLNPNGRPIDWFELADFSNGIPFEFSIDLSSVAGKDVEIILKAQANGGSIPGLFHWTRAEVVCEYDDPQGYDLSVSPSDVDIVPQADPSHVKLRFLVWNVGNAASPAYNLTLTNRSDASQLASLQGAITPAGWSKWIEYLLPVSTSVSTMGLSCRVTASGEGNTANNEACFNLRLPSYALRLKRIDGLPRPWKADDLNVVFTNEGVGGEGYSLSYSLKDFWGTSFAANRPVALPSTVGFTTVNIDLRPSLGSLVGWFEAEVQLKYNGNLVDTRSINISRVAPRPNPLSTVMGIQTFFWARGMYANDDAAIELELIRDMGARYVRCNGVDRTEELLAQGNGEYVMTYIPNNNVGPINAQGYTTQIEQNIYNEMFALVDQWKGRVKYYELGNEISPFISAANTAKMYKTIYDAAKAADPNCIVNAGGLGWSNPQTGELAAWFQSVYEEAGDHIDNVSLHSYTLARVPDVNELLMKYCDQPIETYMDILGANYPAKNIWESEYGWFARDSQARDEQAQNTVRQFLLGARYNIPMIQFLLMDSGYDNSHDGVQTEGLCYFNREPKPAFAAYAALARQLSGASFVEEKSLGSNCFAYVFQKQGSRFMYLWKSVAPEEILTLPALGSSVSVTDMMGNTKTVAASSSGSVSLPLSYYPISVSGLDIDGFEVIDRRTAPNGPDAAQYLGIADNSSGSGGVSFWDISAAAPTPVDAIHGEDITGPPNNGAIYGIAFGPNNDVFVTVSGSPNVYRATYEGNGQWTDWAWSVAFTIPMSVGNPLGLAYDQPHNRMYVTIPTKPEIYRWDFDTAELGSDYVGLGSGYGLAVVGDKLWMGFSDATYIGRLDTTTGLTEAMNATYANWEWPNAPGGGTFAVCGAPDGSTGSAYYTSNGFILKYQVNNPNNWNRTDNSYTVWKQDPTHLVTPLGIVVGTDRNSDGVRDIFVADQNWGEWPSPRVNPPRVVIYSGSDGAYLGTFADSSTIWWGEPRYMAVTAGNTAGLPLDTPVELASLSVGKTVADGEYVHITETIATSSLSDMSQCFYIEEADRSCGMRVVPRTVSGLLERGRTVDVYGTMGTTTAGERQIVDAIVYVEGATTALDPVGMNNRDLGGGNLEDPFHNQGQYGVPGGTGTNNIGLLVRVWGRVIDSGNGYVTIDDGSGVGVRVDTTAAPSTPSTGYIAVTGISSLYGTMPNGTRLILALP